MSLFPVVMLSYVSLLLAKLYTKCKHVSGIKLLMSLVKKDQKYICNGRGFLLLVSQNLFYITKEKYNNFIHSQRHS